MRNIKFVVTATALSTLSLGALAVEPVSSTQTQGVNKTGVISADGATTLDGPEVKLAEKVNAASATDYSIASAIGKDKMGDITVVYK